MATTQLKLYNGALRECGHRKIANLSVSEEARHLLDDVWDGGAIIDYFLEQGDWNFATRATKIDSTSDVTPDFGLQYAFDKPSDWKRTSAIAQDEYFRVPLVDFEDEQAYWFADIDPIYVRYVSNDSSYGGDLSLWPWTFTFWAETHLASRIVHKLSAAQTNQEKLEGLAEKRKKDAIGKDALGNPTRRVAQGSWSRARTGFDRSERAIRTRLAGY